MTVQDLGERASNYEVTVLWKAYDREVARIKEIQRKEQERDEEARRHRL
jgi:hypothetical protein